MERPLDDRIPALLDRYMAALEAGGTPDRAAILASNADLADELAPCLEALDAMFGRAAPAHPRRLGDFQLIRQVGRGGMGVVYEAEQVSLGRRVALKMLPFAGILEPRHLQRFRNEARAAAHLHHTHIVPVYSVGQERGVHYYAMQYVEGISLAELIAELRARAGRDEPRHESSSAAVDAVTSGGGAGSAAYVRTVARLGIQAAQALDHAHELGVVHRDVKPANLMIDTSGHLWVTDFGLASFRSAAGPTMTGDLVGTVRYMSPEQALAKRIPIDHRTDIYSLGVTLYEVLTLRAAFPGDDPHKVIQEIAFREPTAPRHLDAGVPRELETILLKAISKSPDDRYDTAGELASDLQRYLEDRPIAARRPGPLKRALQWGRRHRPVVWAAAAVLVLTMIGFAVGSVLVWRAYERETRAYESEREAHVRSRANLGLALEVLDEIFLEEGRRRIGSTPLLSETDRRFLERGLRFYDAFVEQNRGDPTVRLQTARAYLKAARLRSSLGNHAQASGDAREAASILEALLAEYPGDPAVRRELGNCYDTAGREEFELGEFAQAEEMHLRALDLRAALRAESPASAAHDSALAGSHNALAQLHQARGDVARACEGFERGVALQREAFGADPNSRDQRAQLVSQLQSLGLAQLQLGRHAEAVATHREAVELAGDLGNEVEDLLVRGNAHDGLGCALRSVGSWSDSVEQLRVAVELGRDAVHVAPNLLYLSQALAASLANLGGSLAGASETAAAVTALDESISIQADLVLRLPDVPKLRMDLAGAHLNRALYLWQGGQAREAADGLREGITVCDELIVRFGDLPARNFVLGRLHLVLGAILTNLSQLAAAEEALVRARDEFRGVVELDPDSRQPAMLVGAAQKELGRLYLSMWQMPKGIESYRDALATFEEQSAKVENDPEGLNFLAEVAFELSDALVWIPESETQERESLYRRAIGLLEPLAADPGIFTYRNNLARARTGYGRLLSLLQRTDDAREQLMGACELREALRGEMADWFNLACLAETYSLLGALECAEGNKRQGLDCMLKAAAVYEELGVNATAHPNTREQRAWVHVVLVLLLLEYDRTTEAGPYLREIKELQPISPSTQNALAWFLANCKDESLREPDRAVKLAEQAVATNLNEALYVGTLGAALYRAGRLQEAVRPLERSLDLEQEGNATALLFLAMTRSRLGERDEARALCERATAWIGEHRAEDPELARLLEEAAHVLAGRT